MNDGRQTPPPPEAWKIRFLANGTPGTWFYTDDAAVTKEWLRTHCDDVEVIPLCRMHDGPVFREHHINELSAALARMLHMHHILLEPSRQPGGCGLSWPEITVIKTDNIIVFQVVIWPVQLKPVNENLPLKEANFPAMS